LQLFVLAIFSNTSIVCLVAAGTEFLRWHHWAKL
jgi:hypothetical protein